MVASDIYRQSLLNESIAVLRACDTWRTVEFISDVHLNEDEPKLLEHWRKYMQEVSADALFILGDLFEVWIGDDILLSQSMGDFERECAAILKHTAQRLPVYVMHGNRDFLLDETFAKLCHVNLLNDLTLLEFGVQKILLSHGDRLCVADEKYMQFRSLSRSKEWRAHALAQPLEQRKAMARQLRLQSKEYQRSMVEFADVDEGLVAQLLEKTCANAFIHGHTHQPAEYVVNGCARIVLHDWRVHTVEPFVQAQLLSWSAAGCYSSKAVA